jgi:hypothetical protein
VSLYITNHLGRHWQAVSATGGGGGLGKGVGGDGGDGGGGSGGFGSGGDGGGGTGGGGLGYAVHPYVTGPFNVCEVATLAVFAMNARKKVEGMDDALTPLRTIALPILHVKNPSYTSMVCFMYTPLTADASKFTPAVLVAIFLAKTV